MILSNILLTGGSGYIGSNVFVALVERGYNPIILDNFSRSKITRINEIEKIIKKEIIFEDTDLRDSSRVRNIIKNYKIDAVIHFAAFKDISESVKYPLKYYDNNVQSLIVLLQSMIENNCTKIVYSSSASIYKNHESDVNEPFSENHAIECVNPYASTKNIGEQIIKDASINNNISYSILRYFNPAGSHSSGYLSDNIGINSHNLFPNLYKASKNQIPFIKVYGNDYKTHDGTGVRDYIHIADLAEGHISALNYMIEKKKNSIVNLGSGLGYSVLEVINNYSKACNKSIKYKICPRRIGDKGSVYANILLSKKLFDWSPRKSLMDICYSSYNVKQ